MQLRAHSRGTQGARAIRQLWIVRGRVAATHGGCPLLRDYAELVDEHEQFGTADLMSEDRKEA